jgi:hypothetical protein
VLGATGQGPKTRREAYGAEPANQVEMLLRSLFPRAQVEWSPVLAVRDQSGTTTSVDLGDFAVTKQSDGSVNGVALLELGSAKAEHIERAKKFQAAGGGNPAQGPVNRMSVDTRLVRFRLLGLS